jgi:hypothetical protein
VDAFYGGTDGKLWCIRYRPHHGWSAPASLGDALTSQPSAVTASGGVAVFYRGTNNGLQVVTSQASGWSAPLSLRMGALGGAPVAVSTADGGSYVFWRGQDASQLWGARLIPGAGWHGPYHLASGLASPPSPAVSGPSTVSVFWKGTDGKLWYISHGSSGTWQPAAALPMGLLGTGPYATGQRGGQINVLWGGTGRGSIWHATYTPSGGWSRQTMIALGMHGLPALVASSAGTADAFWKGRRAGLWHATGRGNGGWGGPAVLSMGRIGGGLFAAGRPSGTIDVFWRGTGSPHLWHARYHPRAGRWTGPDNLGGNVG